MVVRSSRIPAPGETIMGSAFFMNPGGKGANQAVAAARLGGEVTFIARVGGDMFGEKAIQGFQKEGIDTSFVSIDENAPSGVATITVDDHAENAIVVAPGANDTMTTTHIDQAEAAIAKADILLVQLEIPLSVVEHIVEKALYRNKKVILNPAPARELSDSLLGQLDVITPNETEAELLTGIKVTDTPSAEQAAKALQSKGIPTVIITLGAKGAYVLSETFAGLVPGHQVKAVDTTAAGDTFNGALAVALAEGKEIAEAVQFAHAAAAISVTRLGAQAATPYRHEL